MPPITATASGALRQQLLLAFDQPLGLRQQGLQARDLGSIAAGLDFEVPRVDLRQQFTLPDLLAGGGEHAHHAARNFGTEAGIDHVLEIPDHVLNHLQVARLDHDGAHQRRRGPGGPLRRCRVVAATGHERGGGKRRQPEAGVFQVHSGTCSPSKSPAGVSRRRTRWARAPETMISAARGRLL